MYALPPQPVLIPRRLRELWWRWMLYMTAGELAGFAVPAITLPLFIALGWSDAAIAPLTLLAGACEGLAVGFAQALVLERVLADLSRREWMVATAWGAVIAYALAAIWNLMLNATNGVFTVAVIIAGIFIGIAFLLTMGTAQWFVLRKHVPRAGGWIAANAIAWPAGVAMPFITIALVPHGSPVVFNILAGVVGGVLMGLIVGALTGAALVWLLQGMWQHASQG